MYKTSHTNRINSARQFNSYVNFQVEGKQDENAYNPDLLVVKQVFEHYHSVLKLRPKLLKELIRRKIDPGFVEQYQIGFSDRTLGYELQSPKSLLGSRNRGHLQRLALLKESGHEFFNGSLVIPYLNDRQQIVGAYGRRLKHQSRNPTYHLYWNAQRVSFFNATEETLPSDLILSKSALDSLTLQSAGFENVVATMGIKGFNEIQLSRLQRDNVRNVYIAFDNIPRANRYAQLVAQALKSVGIACFRIKLPRGQDVNRFAMGQQDFVCAFRKLLDNAVPFKTKYGSLTSRSSDAWLEQFGTVRDCVRFYLEEQKNSGKSPKTLYFNRNHLERFLEYCQVEGIDRVADLTASVLSSYQCYLKSEKNVFTGRNLSSITQIERMEAVSRMLSRLHYYGVFPKLLAFPENKGTLH